VIRVWIDILGTLLFLLPVCLLIVADSWNFFLISFHTHEASPDPGGLAWWPLKFAIPTAFALLSLQGLSEIIKNVAVLTGDRPMPEFRGGH
jgi:TRAP-type mannitol/chloroaromatic compound transport system permease small subunit